MLGLLVHTFLRFLACILIVLIGFWGWFQWKNWDFLQVARKLPTSVKTFPIIGHTYLLLLGKEGFSKFIVEEGSIAAVKRGLYNVTFWCGSLPIVVIHKLEDVQKILNNSSTLGKGYEYDYFKYLIGEGFTTAPPHIWKVIRRHMSPLFHFQNVEQLMTVFNNNSRELVTELAEHVDGRPVNMIEPAMSIALKTVCQLIFGVELDFDRHTKAFKGMLQIVEEVPTLILRRIANPILRVDFIYDILYRRELKAINTLWKDFTESPLKIAKSNYSKRTDEQSKTSEYDGLVKEGTLNLLDVYTVLQKKYPQFTESDLKGEMMTLYCTGTDTIGLTVSSCLMVLGHPDYRMAQDRVYEEIMSVVGDDDDVTPSHINMMQFLDQLYKETLRWSLIVPYISRRTTEDLKLSDCTIPVDNSVCVGLVGIHMNPDIYPNPEKFDPDRFSPENTPSRAKNALMPFSAGARICIAKTYSDHLVKTLLVHVLRRFQVSTDLDIYNLRKKLIVTYVNADGYPLKFQNRK